MKVFIVGDTGLLDGLALWSMADDGDVLLYVEKDVIPEATHDELLRLANRIDEVVVVGGTARVSINVESQLGLLYDAPTLRVAGPSRFATAAAISQEVHVDEPGDVLWEDGFESGNWSPAWRSPSISGDASATITDGFAHTGRYSLKLANWNVDGSHSAGVRMEPYTPQFQPESSPYPDDAYYSCWFHIPFAFEGQSNIFQQKMSDATRWDSSGNPTDHTKRMIWKISLVWDDPKYRLEVSTRVNQTTGEWEDRQHVQWLSEPLVPVGEWFHVETRYVWGRDGTGATTIWLNGEQVYDQQNMSTEPTNLECFQWCRMWAVNHYLGDWQGPVEPADSWLFIDDAKITTGRSGP